jgi:Flp pilus assembly protein TadD
MSLEQKERGLLARIAFFLCRNGQVNEAETVFAALAASEPGKDGPVVGLALCEIIKGEYEKAIAYLDERLRRGASPIAANLCLYKLVALGMSGRLAEARELRNTMDS